MPLYHPGTNNLVTHSYSEAEFNAEFDDALVDQLAWKNSRYDGAKLIAKEINKYTPSSSAWQGDSSWGTLPVLSSQTTALYISNIVTGYKENSQFVDIKNHSYVGINKILIINHVTETVQIIDSAVEPFDEFHRFITNDLPTGQKCTIKMIDESIGSILQSFHRVKMNKGYLLKTLDFKFGGEQSGSSGILDQNNSMYLYQSGSFVDNMFLTGSEVYPSPVFSSSINNALRFKYAVNEMFPSNTGSVGGHKFGLDRIGPSFASASIIENRFTQEFYSGSYGHIKHQPAGSTYSDILLSTGLGSASKFMAVDALKFLDENITNPSLTNQEKTEIHVTFFEGSKDFSKGVSSSVSTFDERSIGTFELDQNRAQLNIIAGDGCNGGLPINYELQFKAENDSRFAHRLHTFKDDVQQAHLQSTASDSTASGSYLPTRVGCTPVGQAIGTGNKIQQGVTLDRYEKMDIVVQGGALGQIGFHGANSSSIISFGNHTTNYAYGISTINKMTTDNFYSGSFDYQYSFLDKDHTLIMDIDKGYELENGIGTKGLVIIPEHSHPQVSFNLEFWLQKAGIIGTNPGNTTQNISQNV